MSTLAVQIALDANERERRRVILLTNGLDEHALLEMVHDRWTVAAKLAHLAYWDRFALTLLERWARDEDYVADALPHWYDDCLNDALLIESLALTPAVTARLAIEAAEAIDARLRALAPEQAARLLTDRDAAWLLRRHNHRKEHLDEIEVALGLPGC